MKLFRGAVEEWRGVGHQLGKRNSALCCCPGIYLYQLQYHYHGDVTKQSDNIVLQQMINMQFYNNPVLEQTFNSYGLI